jgi:type II secretory pathway pseudopilin PulG
MERPTAIFSHGHERVQLQDGYTYLGLLLAIVLIGLGLSGAALVWQIEQQREKERQLIFIGQQYIDAIASYYHSAPGGVKKYPRKLADLLRDSRYLTVKRHLRKPWKDPFTHSSKWGLVYTKQGGIAGVYSLSPGTPLKQSGFGALESLLAAKTSYQEWRFIYIAAADTSNQNANTANPDTENEDNPDENNDQDNQDQEEETGEEFLPPTGEIKP